MAKAHCMAVARDPTTGASLLSATVNVYTPGTVTPISATIFDKSNNVLSNPLTSDATTGLIDFYLSVAQEVDLVVARAGYTTRTYSNVPVIDDASFDLTALLTTTGDLAYASSANTPARLAIGSTNQILIVSGGIPAWSTTVPYGAIGAVAFTTWTPTLNQSGGITFNTVQCTYVTIGKLGIIMGQLGITSAGTAGQPLVLGGVPAAVAPKVTTGSPANGTFVYVRNGVTVYSGTMSASSSTQMQFFSTANASPLGQTPSFATANTDVLSFQGSYEIA